MKTSSPRPTALPMIANTSAHRLDPRAMRLDAVSGDTAFVEYFRCPEQFAAFEPHAALPTAEGYFTFGDAVCYGQCRGVRPAPDMESTLADVTAAVEYDRGRLRLPFELSQVVANLRGELYRPRLQNDRERVSAADAFKRVYYFLRPMLSVGVRRHLQKVRLSGWEAIPFPRWPVDVTVETLMQESLALLLRTGSLRRMPFVWFWPDGARSCAIVTHDVEGPRGRDLCDEVMDVDDSFDVKSAFQVVPEVRDGYSVALAGHLRDRGFEVNLHDLNHDGYLFHSKSQFLQRAARINQHARDLDCRGFRSGAMYRRQEWYDAFEFRYDMSVPNVAHLDPQRGGCCTVMPYFVGDILELPLTTTQDYSLFHILDDYTTRLWRQQIATITAMNGLVTVLTHPDYFTNRRERDVYVDLLTHLSHLRDTERMWITQPAQVDCWWRNRRQMTLVPSGNSWRLEGPESERARVAYATLEDDRVVYRIDA